MDVRVRVKWRKSTHLRSELNTVLRNGTRHGVKYFQLEGRQTVFFMGFITPSDKLQDISWLAELAASNGCVMRLCFTDLKPRYTQKTQIRSFGSTRQKTCLQQWEALCASPSKEGIQIRCCGLGNPFSEEPTCLFSHAFTKYCNLVQATLDYWEETLFIVTWNPLLLG